MVQGFCATGFSHSSHSLQALFYFSILSHYTQGTYDQICTKLLDLYKTWWNEENQCNTVIPGCKLYRQEIGDGVARCIKEGTEPIKYET